MSEKLNSVQSNRKSTPQQLYEAVLKNDLSLVKKLINYGLEARQISWAEVQENHWQPFMTPLQKAVELGCFDIVKLLLKFEDISPDGKEERLYEALRIASYLGNLDMMRLLLDERSQICPSMSNSLMATLALDYAIRGRQIDALKFLIREDADLNYIGEAGTPLMIAAREGDIGIVEFLVKQGVNVNKISERHGYLGALGRAAESGHKEVFDFLLPLVSDTKEIELAQLELTKVLTYQQKLNDTSRQDFFSAVENSNLKTIQETILSGIDINSFDENGRTALHIAVLNNTVSIIDILTEAAANINIQDEFNGYTPLILSVIEWLRASVRYRILADLGKNRIDEWIKVSRLHESTIQTLIAKGADINAKDKNGYTALFHVEIEPDVNFNFRTYLKKILIELGALP